jgi:DNA-binding NarL/FixJ family response regulator
VPITVAIIEDESSVRARLEELLAARPELRLLAACPTAEDALARLPALAPDVVACEIMLPGRSGIECIRALQPQLPSTQFLMLTVIDDHEEIFQALSAGATGYLLKTAGLEHVADAIVELHGGGSPMTAAIARRGIVALQQITNRDAAEAVLTERERQVLDLLARGRIYKEIAAELGMSVATIRSHIFHTYQKLHVRTRAEAVRRWRLPFGWRRE